MGVPSESVVVACAANGAYALPLAVMLRSVLVNLHPARRLDAYVVDDDIEPDLKERVVRSLADRATVRWIAPRRSDFAGLPLWGRMPITTYDKLLIAELLPASVRKAIWLDCDLLVLNDLATLWDTETAGHPVLAVPDGGVPRVSSRFGVAAYAELGIPADAKYFNAGVAVIDCALWRRDGVAGRALAYLRRYRDRVFFWDQEALNAVLAGQWGELDPRWNCILGFERASLPRDGHRGAEVPWILHFSGNLKPWVYDSRGVYHALYLRYLDSTAWRGWRPPRTWRSRVLGIYESSHLRRLLYPVEQWGLRVFRRATLHYTAPPGE